MNVYDWDDTIYQGDSTFHLVGWLYRHRPLTLLSLPRTALFGLLFGLKLVKKQTFKENLYHMFVFVKDMDSTLDEFVDAHMKNVKPWYLEQQKADDLVISASPLFTIERFCHRIGITSVMASMVNPQTGKYTGLNCHGKEKVRRFQEAYPQKIIDAFYSDSLSDSPLAEIANEAFLVKGNEISRWPKKEGTCK